MDKLRKIHWDMIAGSVLLIGLGAILIVFPSAVNEMIAYLIAAAMFIVAIIEFYNYFKKNINSDFYRNDLVAGVFALALGLILLAKKDTIISLIPTILGIIIIVSGVKKLQNAIDLARLKLNGWKSVLTLACINLIFGIIMVICARQAADVITVLIGVGLVFSGGSDLFATIWITRNAKKAFDEIADGDGLISIDDTKE